MNCVEKRHVSHKASMQHLCYLDSFMDELDREVMSLTDRAFKSLCIGDEAIYNDSEFSPSLVSCRKPLAEEATKKTQQNCSLAFKKHETHPHLNGVNDMPWQMNKSSSLFAAFATKKNGDATKMTNGDSWDKSALLSIQRELSEFSSEYQNNITDRHNSQVRNHLKSSEKSNKSITDTSTQSGKSNKGKHSKSSKLKKLNSKNFFLHSELSPFQSWRELNKFPFGLENIEIFQSNGPPEWYDSPLYKKLTMSHRLHDSELRKSELHDSNRGAKECQNTSLPALEDKSEPKIPQNKTDLDFKTLPSTSVPLKTEKHPESQKIPTENMPPPVLLKSSEQSEQRSQSEGDHSAPWRRNRSRAKSAVPIGQSLLCSLTCEKTKAVDEVDLPIKKDVRTMEEQCSTSSTPFNILQLLTPVIPSRQGTGSSEVQAVFSPSMFDLPVRPERELHPSPEIKREGYKSIASSLLFNLKDNRKRVKAMYSPPKFKGSDPTDQNKLSPLAEKVLTKTGQEIVEIPDAKIPSPVHQKAHKSPASVPQETAGQQKSTPSGHINGGMPDDYLALSLLQAGNGSSPCLKSNKSPVVNKATYPSLNLYRKTSPGECTDAKIMQTLSVPGSHPSLDKSTKLKGQPEMDTEDMQRKSTPVAAIHVNKPKDHKNSKNESIHMNSDKTNSKVTVGNVQSEKADVVSLREKYPLALLKKPNTKSDAVSPIAGSRSQDKANTAETGKVEERPVNDNKESMEARPKHLFSARQNNYIKSQRCVSVDVDEEEYRHGGEEVASVRSKSQAAKDKTGKNGVIVSRRSKSTNVSEERKSEQNGGAHEVIEIVKDRKLSETSIRESVKNDASNANDNNLVPSQNDLGLSNEQKVIKGDAFSMKGNTSAKRALFVSKEQVHTKAAVVPKKENAVMDKYEAAKAALEEVIAERNQRKKLNSSTDRDINKTSNYKWQSADHEQELVSQEDYKQTHLIALSQNDTLESVTKDRRGGQKGFSEFKSSSQIVQSMLERDTKHGESHVAEVNLARPCKQESGAEHGQCAAGQIKYRGRDRSGRRERHQSETDNVKALDKVTEHKERKPVPKNISLMTESSRVSTTESRVTMQGEDCLAVQKKSSSFKPEVPPRRGRAGSQSEERLVNEIERKEDRERDNEQSISSENVMKVIPNLPKERGPVRGHVSALKEKFTKEQLVPSSNIHVHDCLVQGRGLKDSPKKDKVKQTVEKENVLLSTPTIDTANSIETKPNPEVTDVSLNKDSDKKSKLPTIKQMDESDREYNNAEDTKTVVLESDLSTKKKEKIFIKKSPSAPEASEVWDNQSTKPLKSKNCSKNSVKEFLCDLFGKSDAVNVKHEGEPVKEIPVKIPETPESGQAESPFIHSITVYDILKQSEPSTPSPFIALQFEQGNLLSDSSKESSCSYKTTESTLESLAYPEGDLTSPARTCEENVSEEKSSETSLSERLTSPPSDVDKGGWVRCFFESARNLTPTNQSNASTPTMGKPALFKVKDNTFSASPVTKTVRPILHKTIPEICQVWSPRDSLSGSERGEEDLFKDCVEVQSPTILSPTPLSTPARSPQVDQASINPKGSGQLDCLTVPEEDEMRSAVSSEVSEGIESCEMSTEETVDETVVTMHTEDPEESKAHSERSGSACSGLEHQSQVKPPVVPPKTEKALRRAMRLTTRRIQKAESKSKSERKGRSSEKSAGHKPERRHHSSDRVLSSHAEHEEPSIYLDSSNQNIGENNNDMLLLKPYRRERHTREHSIKENHKKEMPQLENHANQNSNQAKAKKSSRSQSMQMTESGEFDPEMPLDAQFERPGRTSDKKYLLEKLDRRAHSLDRFLSDKPELTKRPPLRQNSTERIYASNIVTQSFPMTQRKLLQDPDSGQYFVVDMPVQVKTKTFFDPETGSYVQLPVQAHEGSVQTQAQSMEVVKAPPLVLYHGFVPMPVSTLPAQNSTIKLGSVVTPNDLDGFKSSEMERHEEIYQKPKPYHEPVPAHVSDECFAKGEIVNGVR